MGIIRTLKGYFRHELRQCIIDTIDDSETELVANEVVKKVNILDAMRMLDEAWKKVTRKIIQNCWRKAGFVLHDNNQSADEPNDGATEEELEQVPLPPGMAQQAFDKWIDIDNDV